MTVDDAFAFDPEQAGGQGRKRSTMRDSMFLRASVRNLTQGFAAVLRVRNVSEGGMMADPSTGFMIGDRIEVELRNLGLVTGMVAWIAEDRMGIAFAVQIDPKRARKPIASAPARPEPAKPIGGRPGFKPAGR